MYIVQSATYKSTLGVIVGRFDRICIETDVVSVDICLSVGIHWLDPGYVS